MDVGLVRGHAYSITKATKAQIKGSKSSRMIPLIRLRNPWGNEAEWNGAWSDDSAEWQFISDEEKQNLGLTSDADGEFWMSYDDFGQYWDQLEICNLSPESITSESNHTAMWEVASFTESWVTGKSAGGCRKFIDTFVSNPQFIISLQVDPF